MSSCIWLATNLVNLGLGSITIFNSLIITAQLLSVFYLSSFLFLSYSSEELPASLPASDLLDVTKKLLSYDRHSSFHSSSIIHHPSSITHHLTSLTTYQHPSTLLIAIPCLPFKRHLHHKLAPFYITCIMIRILILLVEVGLIVGVGDSDDETVLVTTISNIVGG